MDDKKTHNLFTPDAESEQNFWMMAQQRAAAPGIPAYPGFYPMLRPMGGPPGINPIRHILPQIPTRASNPRTAVSKASLRDPFPGLPRPDMFSSFITGDSLNRDIIWRDECKAGGREVLEQVEMARVNKLDLMPPGNEIVQDMSMATVRSSSQGKDDGDGFPADNDFHRDVESESEFLRKTEPEFETTQTTQLVEVDDVEKPAASSVDIKIAGNDDQKVFGEVDKDVIDGPPSFPVSSLKLKETMTTGNPIKLKIRCDFKEGHKELMAIIGNDSGSKQDGSSEATAVAATASAVAVHQTAVEQSSPQGLLTLAPPSPQTVLHAAPVPSPSMSIVRPKTGRAKTNAELKKQLMEKRAVQYLKGQGDGGSQASSPATSHVDVSSPASLQADVPSPLSTQTESVSTDALDSSYERLALSRNSQNGKGKRPGTLTTGVSDSDSPSLDPTPPTETRWVVGDMLWARVSGHPWWPCIVSPDPFQQMYTKVITRGHKVTFRQYHVLFFGEEGERGWVQESTAIPFEGRTKFENFCDEMIKEQKKDKKNYTVAPNRRRAWEVAVTDAERARTMPRVRRIEEYVTVYDSIEPVVLNRKENQKVDKESSSSTAKASEEGSTQNKSSSHAKQPRKSLAEDPAAAAAASNRSTESGSPPRKKQRLAEPAAESPSHIKLPKNISNQHVIQYTVFCQKRRDSVKSKHPEYDDEQVENCLQEQWSKLDDETRSRFIPMGSDFTYLSQMMATVGMPKAPTGVKRSSRFVKTKKKPTLKKCDKEKTKAPDIKEIVPDGDGKEKGITKEEKRTPRLRTSAEKKCMEVEPPASRNPLESFTDKDAKLEKSSPVQSPLSVAASTGIPPKKRGRKSKEVRASPVEIVEQKPNEMDQAKKVITPAARKEMVSKPVVGIEDEDTEEELDDVFVCFICEKSTKGIEQCQGSCQGHFHPSCLSQSSTVGGRFLCDECFADNHKCFVCKTSDPKTVPCCVSECGRYYHEQCLGAFLPEGASAVASDRPFSCPLHSCFTCQLKKPDKGSMNEVDADVTDLLMCVRCPMAYHMTDSCVSAGSLALTGKYIVCSRHFEPSKAHSLHTKTSSSWCFVCEKGGSVLYCDSCPAAYHAACLQMSTAPSGAWQCPDCSRGKTPLYGDLVWVKFGSYRWWPAEIYHPASLPSNIQDLPHQVGEFPVCFFGSHDYLWLHRGRVFPFREGDKCCREADAKGTAKIFDKAMKEAIAVYRMLNPNAKPPTNSAGDRNLEKLGSEKKKNNHDTDASRMDDDDDDDDKGDGGGDDDFDAESGVCSSQKASTASGDRRTRRAKVRPNSKVLRQLQRQSRALSMLETPRSSIDGRAAKTVNDHETECYRCSRDGVLILCDKPRCPKAYHRRCINKMKLPHGIWLCPWHHCDTCGKAAIQFCSRCPNSYCADHVVNNIVFSYELGMVCSKHPDVKVDVDSQDVATFPLAYLDTGPPVPVQQSKATGEKKRRRKSAKEKPTPSSMDRRSAAGAVTRHKLTDLESGAENMKSGDTPIDKKAVLPTARKGSGSERKGGKRPRLSKSQKSSDAFNKMGNTDTPTVSSAARQSSNPELVNSGALSSSASKNPASQLDSPMFDNSDDEFPQLVIDVPTL